MVGGRGGGAFYSVEGHIAVIREGYGILLKLIVA